MQSGFPHLSPKKLLSGSSPICLNHIISMSNDQYLLLSYFCLKYMTLLNITSFFNSFLVLVFRSPNSTAFPLSPLTSLPSLTLGLILCCSLNICIPERLITVFFLHVIHCEWSQPLSSFRSISHVIDDSQISITIQLFSWPLYLVFYLTTLHLHQMPHRCPRFNKLIILLLTEHLSPCVYYLIKWCCHASSCPS